MKLSVIVASGGRSTLPKTLDSIAPQLRPGDELLVDVNDDAPWGHRARNRQLQRACGDAVMFLDDDDAYVEGALDLVRAALALEPRRMHVFRMRYANGRELFRRERLELGNVSTQMVVVPNVWGRPSPLAGYARGSELPWFDVEKYEGDWHFVRGSAQLLGEPVWHRDVIALVRPWPGQSQAFGPNV